MLKWTTIPYSRPLGSPSNANVLHKQAFRHNTSVSLEKSLHSKSICSRDHSIDFLSSRNVCERSCERHFQISNEDVGSITPFVKLRTSYVGSDLTIWVILPPPPSSPPRGICFRVYTVYIEFCWKPGSVDSFKCYILPSPEINHFMCDIFVITLTCCDNLRRHTCRLRINLSKYVKKKTTRTRKIIRNVLVIEWGAVPILTASLVVIT